MAKGDAFLTKPSMNIFYPNEEIRFMVPNHEKKRRLLCESMFIEIDRLTLILNMVERDFFLRNQSINIFNPNEENVFREPNHEK